MNKCLQRKPSCQRDEMPNNYSPNKRTIFQELRPHACVVQWQTVWQTDGETDGMGPCAGRTAYCVMTTTVFQSMNELTFAFDTFQQLRTIDFYAGLAWVKQLYVESILLLLWAPSQHQIARYISIRRKCAFHCSVRTLHYSEWKDVLIHQQQQQLHAWSVIDSCHQCYQTRTHARCGTCTTFNIRHATMNITHCTQAITCRAGTGEMEHLNSIVHTAQNTGVLTSSFHSLSRLPLQKTVSSDSALDIQSYS